MTILGHNKKRSSAPWGRHTIAALFCAVGIVCFVVAALVFVAWYEDGLGDDMALESRITRAHCLVLDPIHGDDNGDDDTRPRVRFYAPLAAEWIDTRLVSALGHHPRHKGIMPGFLTRHPPGHTIACYYDPYDPTAVAAVWPHVGSLYARIAACATVVLVLVAVGAMASYAALAHAVIGSCAHNKRDDTHGDSIDVITVGLLL